MSTDQKANNDVPKLANQIVWKYQLPMDDFVILQLPQGAAVLCIKVQYAAPVLWALVDPSKPTESRRFRCYGTGHKLLDKGQLYIDTVLLDNDKLVLHYFEEEPPLYVPLTCRTAHKV